MSWQSGLSFLDPKRKVGELKEQKVTERERLRERDSKRERLRERVRRIEHRGGKIQKPRGGERLTGITHTGKGKDMMVAMVGLARLTAQETVCVRFARCLAPQLSLHKAV